MPVKPKRNDKDKIRIWPDALLAAAETNPPTITTARLEDILKVSGPSACQVLRRLQSWGLLRHVGFEDPEGGLGRRRKVYELTTAGVNKVERLRRKSR